MKTCSIEGCNGKHKGLGFCNKHYQKYKTYADPLHVVKERHYMFGTPEYRAWTSMIERCENENHKWFHRYGGRGIKICEEWRKSFTSFYEYIGNRPSGSYELDRIDNNGNYEPGNCRWTTKATNGRNRECVKLSMKKAEEIRELYHDGNITMKEIGDKYGVSNSAISKIIRKKRWYNE